jgi:putative ABC transport system permease protein
MITHYLKIAFRNLRRRKIYSIIKIISLAAGITSFSLIMLYVRYEKDYDTFHQNADRIFRVAQQNLGHSLKGNKTSAASSAGLIIVTLLFNRQLHYMKQMNLGFDKEQMLIIDFQRHNYRYDPLSVKNEFLRHSSVTGASFSSGIPGKWFYPWEIWPTGQKETNTHTVRVIGADRDFLSLYKIDLTGGEGFETRPRYRSWIFNERALHVFGWDSAEEALNLTMMDEWAVSGVMKDFHFTGLQKAIEPVGIFYTPYGLYLSLKLETGNLQETIAFIEKTYRSLFPDQYLEYFFLDDAFNRQYIKEEQTKSIFNIFAILGIFVACLGLYGLSSFIVQQKTKEIGIRKILGASTFRITAMLSVEFVKWVVIASMVACPAAFLISEKILRNFAYRVDSGVSPFLFTILLSFIIAILTVGFQAVRAAIANPVESLRYE